MAEEQKKKKKHTARNVAIGFVAALLLGAGGWYGFGSGGAGLIGGEVINGVESGGVTDTEQQEPAGKVEEAEMSDDGVMQIVVSENEITINGTAVESGELESFLEKNYADGVKVTVKDESAIKAAYDEVISALKKLDISYEIR